MSEVTNKIQKIRHSLKNDLSSFRTLASLLKKNPPDIENTLRIHSLILDKQAKAVDALLDLENEIKKEEGPNV